MKTIGKIEQALGEQGNAAASVGVEGSDLVVQIEAKYKYPIEKVIEPAMKVIDGLVDKLEQVIPGDQKAYAAALKADARKQLVDLLSEQPAQIEG